MSLNLRFYSSPRLFSMDLNIDSDESNFDIFDNNIINDYSEEENCFDSHMMNADYSDEIVDIVDINKHTNDINIEINDSKKMITKSMSTYQ